MYPPINPFLHTSINPSIHPPISLSVSIYPSPSQGFIALFTDTGRDKISHKAQQLVPRKIFKINRRHSGPARRIKPPSHENKTFCFLQKSHFKAMRMKLWWETSLKNDMLTPHLLSPFRYVLAILKLKCPKYCTSHKKWS